MNELIFEKDDLPRGWVKITLQEIAIKIHYGYTSKSTTDEIGPKYLRITDIRNNKVNWNTVPYCKINSQKISQFILRNNDLVFARTGSVGKSLLLKNPPQSIFASYLIRVILTHHIIPSYISFFFQSPYYWNQIYAKKIGIVQPNFNATKLSQLLIFLPPLNEQKRIVSKIESIFAQIDAIKERLEMLVSQTKSTSGSLSILKSSILKQAFKGKLVPQDPNDESAKTLLSQIHKKSKITFKSNNLPKEWIQTELSHLATLNPKLEKNSIDPKLEVSFVPMRYVEELSGRINLSNIRKFEDVRKGYTYFQNHDIIFAKITPCMENGKIAIPDGLKNGIGYGSTEFHVIRLIDPKMSRKFYFYYFIQTDFRKKAESKMKGTAGQLRVPTDVLSKELVLIPPLNEQKRIVSKIESIFGNIDTLNLFYFIVLGNLFTNLRYFIILYMLQCYI